MEVPVLCRMRQDDLHEFEASLSYPETLSLPTPPPQHPGKNKTILNLEKRMYTEILL